MTSNQGVVILGVIGLRLARKDKAKKEMDGRLPG
jgi:hypothetical protein